MKKRAAKRIALAALLLAIYLFGLLLGTCAISAYPVYRQKVFFLSRTQQIAQEYLNGSEETLRATVGANTRILIYDADGTCLRQALPTNSSPGAEPGIDLEKFMPAVLAGRQVFKTALARETLRTSSTSYNDFMIVVGTPIIDWGTVTGAVFLVKNLMDLPEAVMGYMFFFTILYWLSAYFIVSYIGKKRKLDKLQQSYIANVTHAFKTPIASIKALAETLCDGVEPDPDRQKVYYGMILQEANRQDRMVRDVLELSKLQSNGMDFTKTKVRAAEIFEPLWEKYATLCDCIGISLYISPEIARLPPLCTNPACLKQILEILLDNAVKFVPEGGSIRVEASAGRTQAVICVRDSGVGIAKEALGHVFERIFN